MGAACWLEFVLPALRVLIGLLALVLATELALLFRSVSK